MSQHGNGTQAHTRGLDMNIGKSTIYIHEVATKLFDLRKQAEDKGEKRGKEQGRNEKKGKGRKGKNKGEYQNRK